MTTDFPPGTTNRPWPDEWPDWLGTFPRLTGRQWPEFECWHPGDESEGDKTAKFGQRIGVHLLPWEWMVIRALDSRQPANEDGIELFTHRIGVLEATRQQGKTLMLALIIIRRLFKYRRRVVYTAQQYATVEDVYDRVVAIIERVPSLMDRLAAEPSKKDNRPMLVLKPQRGDKHVVKANFGPRTQHFARGFTELDDVIFDEAYDLVPREVANLTGAQAASDNAQTIYASTPPVVSQHPNCHRFSGLVRTVQNGGAPGLYGALYRAPKTFERGDPAAYPLAQPSYGVVGNDRDMESHLQGAQDAGPEDLALFDADWLGWGDYPPPANRRESEIPAEKWREMRNPTPSFTGRPVVVLTREESWAISAAQRTTDGRIHLEIGYAEKAPASVVAPKFIELVTAWNPSAVVVQPGAAAEVIPLLEAAGIEVITPNRTDIAQACGGFLSDATAPTKPPLLSHSGQPGLATAVDNAVRKELPSGGFIWEIFEPASYPQLMGVTLARWALLKYGAAPKRKTVAPRSGATRRTTRRSGDLNLMTARF